MTVLIIDDNPKDLELMSNTIASIYRAESAASAEEAEAVLAGLQPIICLCNYDIKYEGKPYILRLIKKLPNTIHIVITNLKKSKDIISTIQKTKAYMFLNKPLNALNIFQVMVVCTDKYRQINSGRRPNAKLDEDVANIKQELQKAKEKEQLLQEKLDAINEAKEQLMQRIESAEATKEELSVQVEGVSKKNEELETNLNRVKVENEELTTQNVELNRSIVQLENFPNQLLSNLIDTVESFEQFYFTPHLTAVREIVSVIATSMELPDYELKQLIMASTLHNLYEYSLPEMLRLSNPYLLENRLQTIYFQKFSAAYRKLSGIDLFEPYVRIVIQMWEHYDSSGFPRQLDGDRIDMKAHILAIANIYHNMVYRIHPLQLDAFKKAGSITQSTSETANRHKQVLRYFQRYYKWFDAEVFHTFSDLVKDKVSRQLVPVNSDLTIKYKSLDLEPAEDQITDKFEFISSKITDTLRFHFNQSPADSEDAIEYETRMVPISGVRIGMKTTSAVITLNGKEVIPANTIIEHKEKNQLMKLASQNIIEPVQQLQVPNL